MRPWSREWIERTIRKLIMCCSLSLLALWVGGRAGFFPFSKDALAGLQASWLVLFWIDLLLRIRARRLGEADPALDEPSPAVILTILIVLTGVAGVYAASHGGPEASSNVPYLMDVGTVLLASLGYTLAAKHGDQIGEARFKSSTKGD